MSPHRATVLDRLDGLLDEFFGTFSSAGLLPALTDYQDLLLLARVFEGVQIYHYVVHLLTQSGVAARHADLLCVGQLAVVSIFLYRGELGS